MTSDEDGVRVNVGVEVAILTRANVLGHIAREIVSVFSPSDKVLETVLRGIRLQLIGQVELILYNSNREVVGYLSISIDWDKYSMYLETGTGSNTFSLDPSRPITRQLSPLLSKATAYISGVKEHLHVRSASTVYSYRPNMYEKGQDILQIKPISRELAQDLSKAKAGKQIMVSDSELGELTIEFRYQE